jgi:hypothetical protein
MGRYYNKTDPNVVYLYENNDLVQTEFIQGWFDELY